MPSRRTAFRKIGLQLERYWLLMLWILLNGFAFYKTYSQYKGKAEYHYLRLMLGNGLCIAKGSATVLNISCCLVLLPMCRIFNSFVCQIINRFCTKNVLLFWLQNTKTFHIVIAVTITSLSVIHTAAHVQNAINFSRNFDQNHSSINWASHKNENPVKMVVGTLAGLTGVLMLIIILILAVSSWSSFRRCCYNVFWYIHNLCYLFLILLLLHPLSGVIKEQVNVSAHFPNCTTTNDACLEDAVFRPISSQGWLWIVFPSSVYVLDLAYRIIRRTGGVTSVVKCSRSHDGVLLTLPLPHSNFVAKPGQFVLLQCPAVSRLEWHPFTVIQCHESSQPYLQVLIRARGDWSKKLQSLNYGCDTTLYKWPPQKPIRLYVDGPYNSPMEGLIKCKIAIFIAAGVGITPFISAVRHLLTFDTIVPKKIYLVWTVRHVLQIDWSSQWLIAFHNKCWVNNEPDRFTFKIHVTGKQQTLNNHRPSEVLLHRLHIGRPVWKELFHIWKNQLSSQKCHVFACGPKKLTNEIKKLCQKYTNFRFVYEKF